MLNVGEVSFYPHRITYVVRRDGEPIAEVVRDPSTRDIKIVTIEDKWKSIAHLVIDCVRDYIASMHTQQD